MTQPIDHADWGADVQALQAAWQRYLAALEDARAAIEASEQFRDAPDQRDIGYRIVLEAQAMAFNFAIAPSTARPRHYHATTWQTDIYTLGGNGSDFHYGIIFLDGRHRYRLSGNVNDSRLLLAQLNSALPGSPGARLIANYDFSDFTVGSDGSLEIMLGAGSGSGNWIELDASARYQWLMFRPSTHGWDDTPADLRITRLGPDGEPARDTPDEPPMCDRIDAATALLQYFVTQFSIAYGTHVHRLAGDVNRLVTVGAETAGEVGSPSARYINGIFALADDEALIVELAERPDGPYWNVQLFDVWLRSLDFVTRQTSLHGDQIAEDPDGIIRVVISARDPGVANWVDTTGLSRGQMLVRIYRSRMTDDPTVRKVPLADLFDHLPAGVARVTPEQRAAELRLRREAYRQRHGE